MCCTGRANECLLQNHNKQSLTRPLQHCLHNKPVEVVHTLFTIGTYVTYCIIAWHKTSPVWVTFNLSINAASAFREIPVKRLCYPLLTPLIYITPRCYHQDALFIRIQKIFLNIEYFLLPLFPTLIVASTDPEGPCAYFSCAYKK